MRTISSVLINMPNLVSNANSVRDIVIAQLLHDKQITEEVANDYYENWGVIIFENSWIKNWCDKITGRDKNEYTIKFVRLDNKQ